MAFERLLVLAFAMTVCACTSVHRRLHAVGGNEFTLFPTKGKPSKLSPCLGGATARFECVSRHLKEKGREQDVAGALAVSLHEEDVFASAMTDTLNRGTHRVSVETPFPVGSVTKMFLAATAVSLSEDGTLDLHLPISGYVSELSGGSEIGQVSMHHLLSHTSGLGNPVQCATSATDLDDVLIAHSNDPLWAPPGAVHSYSNIGFTFAAIVLERVTGQPFEQLVRERSLLPVDIRGGTFGPDDAEIRGHRAESIRVMPRCRAMWPSGGLVLSARELALWAREFSNPGASALGPSLISKLTQEHAVINGPSGEGYGYGVSRFVRDGVLFLGHSGGLEDFNAFVGWSAAEHLGVAALVNSSPYGPNASALGLYAMSTFLNLDPSWRPAASPAHPLAAYEGTYADEAGSLGRVRVRVEGAHLHIDYLDDLPKQLPATFRFTFSPGSKRASHVVTAVGVGTRVDAERTP